MERMKELLLSPEEIYYIGKVSGGKYLDYDYIAAMKDIGKRGKIKQQEILDSLERKGYAQEDFLGNLEVEPACIEILQPLYQGMYESELILREEAGEDIKKIERAQAILQNALQSLRAAQTEGANSKGQTAQAIYDKSQELINQIQRLDNNLEETTNYIRHVLAVYKAKDEMLKAIMASQNMF